MYGAIFQIGKSSDEWREQAKTVGYVEERKVVTAKYPAESVALTSLFQLHPIIKNIRFTFCDMFKME